VPLLLHHGEAGKMTLCMGAPVNWKLNTRNENVRPPLSGSQHFESQEDALEAACKLMATQLHTKVLDIEGPSGERIEFAHIEAWCKARAARQNPSV
jgi:hypothetical protein